MNSTNYLYAAYVATWVIHIGYLWTVVRRYKKLRGKIEELTKRT